MYSFWQDLRFGARLLLRNPGFTAVAVLSLALGIGANTAIFQLLNTVRLKTLPVDAPQELAEVRIKDMDGARGSFSTRYNGVTNPIWEELRNRQQGFAGIFAWGTGSFNLSQGGEARPAKALWVSGDFFNVLRVPPVLGRVFTASDDQRGCNAPGVVISHAFWQREYGGDAGIIGRKITLANRPFEIIGVTPASFYGLEVGRTFDLALPICADAVVNAANNSLDSGTTWWLMVTGRLKPGWSLQQATSDLQTISPGLFAKTMPANYPAVNVNTYLGFKFEAVPAGSGYSALREDYERPLWLLLAIAGLVLLVACANLANLLLARASAREREMAVRQAVGASRGRLVRQLLIESLLLAIVGAVLGGVIAQTLSKVLVSFLTTTRDSVFLDLAPDWRVLGFAAAAGVATCVLFGLTPALRATRIEPGAAMKASARGLTAGRERFSLRRALVVLQVALSLVLVAGAVLFSRSLNKLTTMDAGFQQDGILIARANFGRLNLAPERRLEFRHEISTRLKAIPGVQSVADTNVVPLSGNSWNNSVWLDGGDGQRRLDTEFSQVSSEYFKTLNTPLLAGRDFGAQDGVNSPKVAIVNQSFVRKLFDGANPVGRRFRIEATPDTPETVYEIVGLVPDTKYDDLRADLGPLAFLASAQDADPSPNGQFLIRSTLPPDQITAGVKRVLTEINPSISVTFQNFKTMISESLLRERLIATLSGFFGLLALLLASIGLYGILSYNVTTRTKEIGIRMALGARAGEVRTLVLREALLLVLIGVAVGVPAVFASTRFASTLLFQLTPTDPLSLGVAAILLVVVGMVAGYIPARRATKVDPLVALRDE
jgi:putative ABC transport system permease protein